MIRQKIIELHWLLSSQFGLDLRNFFRSIRGIPIFIKDWGRFREGYSGKMTFKPCLHDRYEEGGSTKNEYFWQDLVVARWIFEAQPLRHVDVGSRVDGFVAHVASFREIEVFDVRPITTQIQGIVFKQANVMTLNTELAGSGYCDSLSCLHAIEHFGLGRYGDPINPLGYESGIANMAKLLKPGGRFYLSTPVGKERVEFNANRIFAPSTIIQCAESNDLRIHQLMVIGAGGAVREVQPTQSVYDQLSKENYNLAIFVFTKQSNAIDDQLSVTPL